MPMTLQNKRALEEIDEFLKKQELSDDKRNRFTKSLIVLCNMASKADLQSDITEKDELIKNGVEGCFAGIFSGGLFQIPTHFLFKLSASCCAGVLATWLGLEAKALFRERDYFDLTIIKTLITNKIAEGMEIDTIIDHLLFNINVRIDAALFKTHAMILGGGAGAAIATGGSEVVQIVLDNPVVKGGIETARAALGKRALKLLSTGAALVADGVYVDGAAGGFGTHYGRHYTQAFLLNMEGLFADAEEKHIRPEVPLPPQSGVRNRIPPP